MHIGMYRQTPVNIPSEYLCVLIAPKTCVNKALEAKKLLEIINPELLLFVK